MNDTIVILDERDFHLRINGVWHHGLTRERSRWLLLAAGIGDHDAYLLLDSAVWWPDPAEIEYQPTGRRRWTVDGRPVTRDGAAWEFRQLGMTHGEIAHLLRIHRLCYEIEARLPPPPPDCMTVQEFGRLFADELAHALSLRVARRWVQEHLRPARFKHSRKLDSWKQQFGRDHPKRRITRDDFAKVFSDGGIKVLGDDVYATEIRA